MTRKCHHHRPQTKPRHQKKKIQSTGSITTARTHLKQSNHVSLPQPDNCKSRKNNMNHITKQEPITQNPAPNGINNSKQGIKNKRITTLEWTVANATGEGDLIYTQYITLQYTLLSIKHITKFIAYTKINILM